MDSKISTDNMTSISLAYISLFWEELRRGINEYR